jgi:hypothetical protein
LPYTRGSDPPLFRPKTQPESFPVTFSAASEVRIARAAGKVKRFARRRKNFGVPSNFGLSLFYNLPKRDPARAPAGEGRDDMPDAPPSPQSFIMIIGWRKAKKLFAARLCRAAKQHGCFAIYALQ